MQNDGISLISKTIYTKPTYLDMTNKRNTLLYLDKDLVTASKKAGLNLSLVAEEALRSRLPYYGEFRPETHLMQALEQGSAAILPLRIEELHIIDKMVNKTIELKGLNLIVGGNNTGKSTIFRLICGAFKISQLNRLSYHLSSKIEVTIAPTRRIDYGEAESDSRIPLNTQCLVTDTLFTQLDGESRSKMLKYLIKTGAQLVLMELEVLKGAEKFNVIKL